MPVREEQPDARWIPALVTLSWERSAVHRSTGSGQHPDDLSRVWWSLSSGWGPAPRRPSVTDSPTTSDDDDGYRTTQSICSCLGTTPLRFTESHLRLQRRKKALLDSIIPTFSFLAHALNGLQSVQRLLVHVARVLTSSIRVMQQSSWWFPTPYGHLQRRCDQRRLKSIIQRPADNFPRIQVHHRRQVQPALMRR